MQTLTTSGEIQKIDTEMAWPKQYKFRRMVSCPVLLQKGVQLVPVEFCLERNNGHPCENFKGIHKTKHGDEIVCAIPKGRAVVEIPVKE